MLRGKSSPVDQNSPVDSNNYSKGSATAITTDSTTTFPAKEESHELPDKFMADASNEIMMFFSLLSKTKSGATELKPLLKYRPGNGFEPYYDLGEGLEVSYQKIRQSEKKGLLKGRGFLSFPSCPRCESLNLRTLLCCPDCNSKSLIKSDLLIHYQCQTTGPIEEFQSSLRNGYYCEKCRKDLKRVGIDYGNPGIGFKCSSCQKVFQFPLILAACEEDHAAKVDELMLKSFPIYVLGNNAGNLATMLLDTMELQEKLQALNIESQLLSKVRGASGTYHLIPLLLMPPDDGAQEQHQPVALEFIQDDRSLDEAIIQLVLKSADLVDMKMIIVFNGSESTEHITPIINPKKVKILPRIDIDSLSHQIAKELVG